MLTFERGDVISSKDYIITGNLVVTNLSWYIEGASTTIYPLIYANEGSKISFINGAHYGIIFIVETTSGTFEVAVPQGI